MQPLSMPVRLSTHQQLPFPIDLRAIALSRMRYPLSQTEKPRSARHEPWQNLKQLLSHALQGGVGSHQIWNAVHGDEKTDQRAVRPSFCERVPEQYRFYHVLVRDNLSLVLKPVIDHVLLAVKRRNKTIDADRSLTGYPVF